MAKGKISTNKKKSDKAKASKKVTHDPKTDPPKLIAAKGGLTGAQLLTETLLMMEDETRISKKAGRDFMDSMVAVVEQRLGEGEPVNIFGLVKLVPRLHTKGVRMVNEEFGNPESKKIKKTYPAKVSVKATVFKRVKDALPSVQKLTKKVG